MARKAPRELDPDEVLAALSGPSGVMAPGDAAAASPDGIPEYTAAELALLEQAEGWSMSVDGDIDLSDEAAFEDVGGSVTRFLSTPRGKPIEVKVTDEASSNDLVYLYDTVTGQPYPIARASIQFYLKKIRADGRRVFSPRRTVAQRVRPYECKAIQCLPDGRRKRFETPELAQHHYEFRHRSEAAEDERRRQRQMDEEMLANNRNLSALLGILVTNQGGLNEETLKQVTAATSGISLEGLSPRPDWTRERILGWMELKGIPFKPEYAGLHNKELCIAIGALEPEAAVA